MIRPAQVLDMWSQSTGSRGSLVRSAGMYTWVNLQHSVRAGAQAVITTLGLRKAPGDIGSSMDASCRQVCAVIGAKPQ